MPKLLNKFIATSLFSLTLLPAQFVHAQMALANPDALIQNIQHAQSVDFSVDIDVTESNSQSATSSTAHIDLDGVADDDRIGSLEAAFSSVDQNGKTEDHKGSVVITPETLYFSENGVWYSVKQNASFDAPTETELADGASHFKSYMEDMFNRGVMTYKMETVEFVNGKLAVRYGYTVNYDKFIVYLLEKHAITESQAKDAQASARGVVISGQFWVDTAAMLPMKLTFNVNGTSGSEHGDLKASVNFNSFNQPVTITEPKNAVSFEQYHKVSPPVVVTPVAVPVTTPVVNPVVTPAVVTPVTTVVPNVDTDNDGLTDVDEKVLWKTNPMSSDSDHDGYADKIEIINGYNPNGTGKLDSDNDGLSDYRELTVYHSDRYNADSDGDGYSDALEVANGYNPIGAGRM